MLFHAPFQVLFLLLPTAFYNSLPPNPMPADSHTKQDGWQERTAGLVGAGEIPGGTSVPASMLLTGNNSAPQGPGPINNNGSGEAPIRDPLASIVILFFPYLRQ